MSSSVIFTKEVYLVVEFVPVEILLFEKLEEVLVQGMYTIRRAEIGLSAFLKHPCPFTGMICRALPLWLCFAFGRSRPSETAYPMPLLLSYAS